LPLSSLTRRAIHKMSFGEIAQKRRNDYQFWQERCADSNVIIPLFVQLPSEVCPMGFPVKVRDRDALKSRAHSEGIHLNIYWRLPSAVNDEFRSSRKLATEVLTLPIYPDLDHREREIIGRIVSQCC
jgi:dTDP-4-amino-4,6-dideoxygalactose transaminase